MFATPLINLFVAQSIQRERRADAERWRLASSARHTDDLAAWLERVGAAVVRFSPEELVLRRPLLEALVRELLVAARDGGIDVPICIGDRENPVVLARILGWLAGRTASRSIRVSRRQRSVLQTALDAFLRDPISTPLAAIVTRAA